MKAIPSEEALKEVALTYALRFPGTTERMRRHLRDKVAAAVEAKVAPGDAWRWIDKVVATLTRVQVLDDARYAEHRAMTLHLRGRSSRVIAQDLKRRAAPEEAIRSAVHTLEDGGHDDWKAALRLARKRRLGPFGSGLEAVEREARLKARTRQLGTLARAGFSFEIARRIVDARDTSSLED